MNIRMPCPLSPSLPLSLSPSPPPSLPRLQCSDIAKRELGLPLSPSAPHVQHLGWLAHRGRATDVRMACVMGMATFQFKESKTHHITIRTSEDRTKERFLSICFKASNTEGRDSLSLDAVKTRLGLIISGQVNRLTRQTLLTVCSTG